MKKFYETPVSELIVFRSEDILEKSLEDTVQDTIDPETGSVVSPF
jgi:hypothetical protein